MNMDDLPRRKQNRLENYDYSQCGLYFITICTNDKIEYFGTIAEPETPVGANCVRPWSLVRLLEYGMIVKNEIQKINSIYDSVGIDKYVIMPNHIHMIIRIEMACDAADGRTQFAPTVSRLIKQFKGSITKQIGFSVWQKSFHDHIIRNQKEYREIWRYINNNPINWRYDELYIERR